MQQNSPESRAAYTETDSVQEVKEPKKRRSAERPHKPEFHFPVTPILEALEVFIEQVPEEYANTVTVESFDTFCKRRVLKELQSQKDKAGERFKSKLEKQLTGEKQLGYENVLEPLTSEAVSRYVGLSYRQGNRRISQKPDQAFCGGLYAWGGQNFSITNIVPRFPGAAPIILRTILRVIEPLMRKRVVNEEGRQESIKQMKELFKTHPLVFLDFISNDLRSLWTEYLTTVGLGSEAEATDNHLNFDKMLAAHTQVNRAKLRKQAVESGQSEDVSDPLKTDPTWALVKRMRSK